MRSNKWLNDNWLCLVVGLVLLVLPSRGLLATPPASLPAAITAFFQKFVNSDGLVNYAAIKRNPLELKALLNRVASFDAANATLPDREAFYLNAYNLLVISEVVARYPLASVEKVPGFFDKNQVNVAGEQFTLNELENKKLRQPYHDPRVHFALVCAAKGCPHLSRVAYVGNQLNAQLNTQARKVLQNPAFVRLDKGSRTVQLSQIFKWYEEDFKVNGQGTVAYVNQFRDNQPIPTSYLVDYYAYDWSLNEQK